MRWTGGRRSGPESPANGGVPPQAGARRAPATVEVPPPADDISSAAHSRVAQLVEQPAVNRRVAGSSPASGASQPSARQSLSHAPFFPSGAGDGLVTVSGSLSGVGTAHARSSIVTAPSSPSSRSCTCSGGGRSTGELSWNSGVWLVAGEDH